MLAKPGRAFSGARGEGMAKAKPVEAPSLFGDDLAAMPEPIAVEVLKIWNEIAPKAGWPEAKFLTASRRAAIKRAVADYGGVLGWRVHLTTASTSDFLTGKSRRAAEHVNWRPDLDWFLKPANVIKILENKYSGVAPSASVAQVAPASRGTDWRGKLERYKKGGWWHRETDGNRPEDPGPHKAPAEMIEAWRQRHGIVERPQPSQETRATRLAASVVSYRRLGQYDRANAIENELAALEGRPAVLVPAADVADHGMPQRAEKPPQRTSNMGHNRPPGPITDVPMDEPPPWEDIPEGDPALAEP